MVKHTNIPNSDTPFSVWLRLYYWNIIVPPSNAISLNYVALTANFGSHYRLIFGGQPATKLCRVTS